MNQFLMFLTTFIIQFVIATEMNIISPLAPFLSEFFGIKDSYVILFNIGYSAVGIFVPFLGILSDRYGKKRILSVAVVVFFIGTLIASLARSPYTFAFGRIFIGLGYFSLSGTNISYISEFVTYENRGKASGILRLSFGLSILLSPIFATTLISRFNNVASIYLPLSFLAFISYLLLLKLPETKKSNELKFNKQEFIQLLKDPRGIKIFSTLFFLLTAPMMLLNFLGLYLSNQFDLSQVQIGLAYTIIAIGTLLGILVAAIFTDKIGKLRSARIFFMIMVLSLVPLIFVKSIPIIIILSVLFAFGLDGGWTAFQTYASEIQPAKRGTFMSLFYTVNALTVTLYSILGSLIYNYGGFSLAITVGVVFSAFAMFILFQLNGIDSN